MPDANAQFAGSIPAIYDRYLGPLLFEPYAAILARRLAHVASGRVLETAAGTGVLTRSLLDVLAPDVAVVATDLNQPMLDHAAARTPAGRVAWRASDAQALPFADGAFEAVACQFGVMFFPDRSKAYAEARRVLAPGGTFVMSVWDRLADNELAEIVSAAVAEVFEADPPRFLQRTPHGYHDLDVIRGELNAAGFADVACECVARRSVAHSAQEPAVGFCQGTPLRNEIEVRDAARLPQATAAAAAALAARYGNGPVDGKMQGFVITARRH